MTTLDYTYINRFRGILGWNAFIDGAGNHVPHVEIELFISSYPMPVRKVKATEYSTISQIDPVSQKEIGSAAIFYGPPDVLQMELSGWIITLQDSSRRWKIFASDGTTSLTSTFGNIPYSEIINSYLSGVVNLTAGGATQRKDPDYYISPQGYMYNTPLISNYQPTFQPGAKKQMFEMTLFLET